MIFGLNLLGAAALAPLPPRPPRTPPRPRVGSVPVDGRTGVGAGVSVGIGAGEFGSLWSVSGGGVDAFGRPLGGILKRLNGCMRFRLQVQLSE
jgi:hypothetical protein